MKRAICDYSTRFALVCNIDDFQNLGAEIVETKIAPVPVCFCSIFLSISSVASDWLYIDRVWLNYHLLKILQANNTLHIFHPFFTIPIKTLAIVKIEQKSTVHFKINNNWMQDIRGAHFLPTTKGTQYTGV